MKPNRCLCHVVLLPQETSRGQWRKLRSGVFFFFVFCFSGEKKSANAILKASEEGLVIAWGTHNSAPGHTQSLFFQ